MPRDLHIVAAGEARRRRQRTVRVAEPADRGAGLQLEGLKPCTIDLERLAAMGYLTPDAPRSQIADEFRIIKRPLLDNINGKSAAAGRACQPDHGDQFGARRRQDLRRRSTWPSASRWSSTRKVLLVDADVARPAVLQRLGLPPSPGLLDLLADPIARAVRRAAAHQHRQAQSILPAGTPHGHATELLASDGMSRLLEDLATRYPDRVHRVRCAAVAAVDRVARAGHAHGPGRDGRRIGRHDPQKTVMQALATIESCPVVMPLLNKTSRSEVGSYYGYYGSPDG